jgi:large repetitive protein
MRRFVKPALVVVLTILTAGIFLKGTIPQPAIGNWLAAGSMTAPRSGAASALLQDGRILITGGDNGAGPVASAEVFDTAGSFAAIAPMGTARSAHSATILIDGRVLVAGGSTGATATNSAEIFDPAASTWTPVAGGMIQARSHHTASLLADGRVLFAGGDNAGTATASLEIFDPVANSFSSVGAMASARTSFASAILSDGQVVLIGGSNGSAPVASTEIFDPVNNSVAPGPALSAPRMAHSATTLLDGRVLVAGGTTVVTNPDGSTSSTDLASAEIYDPATGNFTVSASSLAAPRRDHAAFLLPNNNSVLIVGGTFSGNEIGTAEMFLPSTGTFAATGSPSVARQHATGSALSQDGILFLAGGSNSTGTLSSAELYGFATVKTDKADYPPGATVTITGSGWQPGETVTLTLVESPLIDTHGPFTTVADTKGNIADSSFTTDAHDLNIRFYLTAVGSVSGIQAQNTFTDANDATLTTVACNSTTVVVGGASTTCTATVKDTGGNNGSPTGPVNWSVLPSDGTFNPTSCNLTTGVSPTSTCTATFRGTSGGNATITAAYQGGGSGNIQWKASNGTLAVTVNQAPNITSVNNTTFTAGTAGTFTVAATGFPAPTFSETGTLPSGVTLSAAGVLSGTPGANTGGTYQITITASNGVSPGATQIFTLTVNNLVPTTTSISPTSKNVGDAAFTLTVNGTNFVASSAVNFNGSTRTTTFVNATQLTASIPATDLLTAGTFNISVTNSAPGGGTSNAQTLTVDNLLPTTTSISPSNKNAGDAAFTLTVNGTNFVSTSVVNLNGSARTTTFVSPVQLTASITAADVATAGTCNITVTNPAPGGGTSNAQALTVSNPVPTTTSISPATKTAGDAAFTLTVNGTSFVSGSIVNFNGSPRTTTFLTATQVTAVITAADVASAGTFNITVVNAAPGGGTSNAQVLTVNPKLVITSAAFTTVTGVCSPTITAQTQNGDGTGSSGARTLTLSGPATAKFFSDAACSNQITSVGIAAGSSSANFFYTDTAQGNSPLIVGSTGLTSATQTESYTGLRFASNAFSVALGQCSTAFIIQSGPLSGPAVSPTQNVTVALSSSFATGKFYSDATCATQVTTNLIGPGIDGGHDTAAIFYKDATAGSPTITATAGAASTTQAETITKATPTFTVPASQSITYGTASITLSGTLASGSLFPPNTESVSITINNAVTSAAIGANGAFSATVNTSVIPASLTAYTISYSYAGDGNFNSATNTATTLTVNKAATTTTVGTVAPEPSNINQSYGVSWSVAVNAPGAGTPTGTVTVDDGNGNACSAAVAAGSCSLVSTSAGTKTITATYSGDTNFTGSAGTKSHVVNNPATMTTVSSSLNPSAFGQAVMFTATVASTGGTPTGNVTFYDSATCSGTVLAGPSGLDVNGKTAFSTNTLNAVSHTITACYIPTGIYLASSSSVVQVVNQAQATLSFDNLTFTYDGAPKPVTVTTSPANLTGVTVLYNGSATPPTSPGTTPVSATLTNANYTATPISGTDLIQQASTITSAATTTFIAGTASTFNVTTVGFPTASLMETGALPNGVLFTDKGNGTAALAGTATVAGSYPITIAASNGVGSPAMQAFTLIVTAGDFTKLQLLVPGETAAPGTASGKTGTPNTEYVNGAFNVIVNAVDTNWNVVSSVTDTVNITSTDTDPNVKLPANAALVAGTRTFSVTLQTVSSNPAITTLTASDVTDSNKTESTSPAIEVIVVYTAGIAPTMVATGDSVAYTLTVNNAAAPNTNTLRSVTVAIPAEGGMPSLVSITAANAGPMPANWTADLSQISSHLLRFTQNAATEGLGPGGTISIQFTTTATNPVSGALAQNVWTTTAFSDAAYTSALPLAGTEPTVGIGARPVITSADHTTNEFTYGAPGTFTITTSGFPTPSLTKSGSLPGGVTFTDNGYGTATLAGTPTTAGSFTLSLTAHNGYGSDAVQAFTLTVNKAIVMANITADDKDYDGTTAATIHCTLSGVLSADTANVTCNGTGNFVDANAGMGKTVTSSNLALSGSASGNYMLSTTTASTTAKINPRAVTASIVASDKVYDGKNTATITACTIPGKLGTDEVACSVPAGNAAFASASASPSPQTVTATGIILTGSAAGNYTLGANTSATTTATISPAMLTITASNGMMTYGGAPFVVTPLFEGFVYGEGFSNLTTQPACLPVFTSATPSGTYITTCTGAVDSNYAISYKSGSVMINQATTTTALTFAPSTINYGQSTTVSATVSPQYSGTPSGTVSVSDGIGAEAGDSCTITLVSGAGTCTLTPSAATSSPATVSGSYSGDTNFRGSSGSASLAVNPAATSSSVSSSKDPSNYGDSLTFTASVTDSTSGDTAVPTGGTVQFVVDGANFGLPVNLTAGTATSSATTSLAAGQHVVTAVFAGDMDFTGSTSPFLIQTVTNNLSSIVVNPPAPTIVVGQTQRFTGTGTFADGSSAILPPGSTWATGNSMTSPVSAPMAAAGNNGTTSLLYFFGGQDGSGAENFVQTYNPTTGVWGSASNSGFTARYQGTAVASGGLIYVIGGSQSTPTSTVEAYDPTHDTWSTKASISHPSACSVGGSINGLIYVLTGCDGNPGFSKEFDVYNTATNTWSSLTSPTHTHNLGAGGVINGKFYVAGGYDQGTGTTTNIAESYDPQTSTWTTMTAMPAALGQLAGAVVNQRLYAIGGVDGSNSAQSTVYVYDPTQEGSNPWNQLPSSLSQGRSNIGAVPFDGLLYAAGGGEPSLIGMLEIIDTDDVTLASDNASVATVGANTGVATGVTPGTANISATSATYSISGKAVLTVIKANTTTSLSSSLNPSTYGQAVTFTATVSVNAPGAGAPTGSVSLYDGGACGVGTTLASGLTLTSVSATFTTSSLSAADSPHSIIACYSGDTNFNATGTSSSAATPLSQIVNPAVLTVTANPQTKVYGQTDPTLTFAVTGFQLSDTVATVVTGTLTRAPGETVAGSPYAISQGTLTANSNYKISFAGSLLTISRAPASITPAAASKIYGAADPSLTGTLTGFLTADAVTAMYSRMPGETVAGGPYAISATLSPATVLGNYNITYNTASFTINPAPLTITASSGSYTYGGPVFPVRPIYGGFANGDKSTNLTTPPSCGTTATSLSPVIGNPYVSSCSGAVDSNYIISYAPGIVTVSQATTTTAVVTSVNPSTFMQLVTFTATVTPQYSGTVPTGTVTFYNNGSSIGTSPVSVTSCGTPPCPDQATFSTPSLPDSGPDSITVVYNGDGNFLVSTSPAIIQTVQPAPNVSLSPMSVSFGNQNVNTTSKPAVVTLSNIGDAPLNISTNGISITPTTDFTQTNTCGSTVLQGKSCTISITFTPVDTGIRAATLQITDNDDDAMNAQQTVSLTGAGLSTITGTSLYTDAIFATANGCGSIVVSGGSTVDSFNSTQGFSSSHLLSGGNVGTNGNVTLNGGKSAIYGSAAVPTMATGNCSKTSLTGVTTSGGAQVTGGLVPLNTSLNYPVPPAPTPAPPTTTQNISGSCGSISTCTNTGTKTVSLAPGQYGNLNISGGTTAHFSKGTYNINSLSLTGQSILYVDSGPVVVNLAGASLSGGNAAMDASGGTIQNPSGNPATLQFTYAGSRGLNLSGGSASYATVDAPNALVNMSGGSDFFGSIIASTVTNSGGTAMHGDTSLPAVQMNDYIWFNAVVNNVNGLPANGSQVKLYLTNSSISFTANGTSYNVAVPNAVVTFNSSSQGSGAKTSYDLASSRWSTSVAKTGLTGNTFVTGVAFAVPSNFPTGIQNVAWSTSFSTDTPGITLQWQWAAAVYSSFSSTYATASPLNANLLSVNAEDGSADMNGNDPAGTPEAYKTALLFGATGGGGTNYTGYFTPGAGVVPTVAPMSVSPSSLGFGPQNQGTVSTSMTTVLTNNDSAAHTIFSIAVAGTNAANFTQTNNCPMNPNTLAGGASCTIAVTFTPSDVGTRTAKIVLNDDANNSPQTVYLSGTGQ